MLWADGGNFGNVTQARLYPVRYRRFLQSNWKLGTFVIAALAKKNLDTGHCFTR